MTASERLEEARDEMLNWGYSLVSARDAPSFIASIRAFEAAATSPLLACIEVLEAALETIAALDADSSLSGTSASMAMVARAALSSPSFHQGGREVTPTGEIPPDENGEGGAAWQLPDGDVFWKCEMCANEVRLARLDPMPASLDPSTWLHSGEADRDGVFGVPQGWMKLVRANVFQVFCSFACVSRYAQTWAAVEGEGVQE